MKMENTQTPNSDSENEDYTIPDFFRTEFPQLAEFLKENLIKDSH